MGFNLTLQLHLLALQLLLLCKEGFDQARYFRTGTMDSLQLEQSLFNLSVVEFDALVLSLISLEVTQELFKALELSETLHLESFIGTF